MYIGRTLSVNSHVHGLQTHAFVHDYLYQSLKACFIARRTAILTCDIDIAISMHLSVCPSVCLLRSAIVPKRLILHPAYGSPISLSSRPTKYMCEIPTGSPPKGELNTSWIYRLNFWTFLPISGCVETIQDRSIFDDLD